MCLYGVGSGLFPPGPITCATKSASFPCEADFFSPQIRKEEKGVESHDFMTKRCIRGLPPVGLPWRQRMVNSRYFERVIVSLPA